MNKVFHFDSPRTHYKCDAAVVWCFDNRFELLLRKLVKRLGIVYYDPIRIAGGTKYLASPQDESERQFVLNQIRISMRLHETKHVILMLHSDCGAYGGLAAFAEDPQKEAEHHRVELQRATSYLLSQNPELTVTPYFVDFDGVWQFDQESSDKVQIA
ncbi:MAG TPA: carbonic anhydrase [Terriglobales bacterium]